MRTTVSFFLLVISIAIIGCSTTPYNYGYPLRGIEFSNVIVTSHKEIGDISPRMRYIIGATLANALRTQGAEQNEHAEPLVLFLSGRSAIAITGVLSIPSREIEVSSNAIIISLTEEKEVQAFSKELAVSLIRRLATKMGN